MELLLNAKQMKACDEQTIGLGIPSMVLMERAALAVVDEMGKAQLDLSKVLVVCGSGNNGGDGFAVARILFCSRQAAVSHGGSGDDLPRRTALEAVGSRQVTVWFVGKESSMTKETMLQRSICENCGLKISSNFPDGEYTTIVDAMLGIGLSRAVEGRYAEAVEWISAQNAQVVAVDIPSGISADSGCVLGTAVRADLTVTFAARKLGQVFYPGAEYCGRLVCRDIGIQTDWNNSGIHDASPCIFTYTKQDLTRLPKRVPDSHKGTYGKVLLIAGSEGMSGAACLAARAAFRSGCGMVRVFTPACNRIVIQTVIPEAMVTTWEPGKAKPGGLEEALAWSDVVGIGPGLGTSPDAKELLCYILNHSAKPLVIDADAINLLSAPLRPRCGEMCEQTAAECSASATDDRGKIPLSVQDSLKGRVILTPHLGEIARLTGMEKHTIAADPIETARSFADTYEVVCVLKNTRTVVSDGSRTYLNTSGNDGMAVAGSGDVLTGVLCGLLAQKVPVYDAATLGVYLHGLAGDAARDELGAHAVMAGDLCDFAGKVIKKYAR